ncbi:hypothetical protein M3Y94_00069000 [Aphelenchoides besseyi]|nr:hypothetical protein M3Y94_00069000 [Aphelenchoides besseyi]
MGSMEFSRRVMGSIAAMFNDHQNYDFVVKVEDKEFKILKMIVGWQSEVFQRMFVVDMREKFENQLVISNFSAEVVEQMLRFCYTGSIDKTSSELVMKVYEIAHLYQMTILMNTCKILVLHFW